MAMTEQQKELLHRVYKSSEFNADLNFEQWFKQVTRRCVEQFGTDDTWKVFKDKDPLALTNLVFVYGTLMPGEPNSHVITDLSKGQFLGSGSISGWALWDLGAFPCITETGNPQDRVWGHYYMVDTMKHLDRLEGYPRFYDRKVVSVNSGNKTPCWVYYHESTPQNPVRILPEDANCSEAGFNIAKACSSWTWRNGS